MTASQPPEPTAWNFTAALAAWLVPGLGHYLLGQRRRGGILASSILILWIAGLAIGGVSVIDHQTHPAWFAGQALVAPSLLVNYYHVRRLKPAQEHAMLADRPPVFEPSFGRTNEQGVLYTALAGLLNLLAILDVMYRDPRKPRVTDATPTAPA